MAILAGGTWYPEVPLVLVFTKIKRREDPGARGPLSLRAASRPICCIDKQLDPGRNGEFCLHTTQPKARDPFVVF